MDGIVVTRILNANCDITMFTFWFLNACFAYGHYFHFSTLVLSQKMNKRIENSTLSAKCNLFYTNCELWISNIKFISINNSYYLSVTNHLSKSYKNYRHNHGLYYVFVCVIWLIYIYTDAPPPP